MASVTRNRVRQLVPASGYQLSEPEPVNMDKGK
jgi:hypothetical protein